jgi:uncharacterized damage-inducible protein DinB
MNTDPIIHGLTSNLMMLTSTVADLTDAELLVRPVPGANHANWQLGHILSVENRLAKAVGVAVPELPADFAEKYSKAAAANDGAANFASKEMLLPLLEATRRATMEWLKTATPEQLATAAPEPVRRMAPTVIDVMVLFANHFSMHMGQMQVLRRKLGKPILF